MSGGHRSRWNPTLGGKNQGISILEATLFTKAINQYGQSLGVDPNKHSERHGTPSSRNSWRSSGAPDCLFNRIHLQMSNFSNSNNNNKMIIKEYKQWDVSSAQLLCRPTWVAQKNRRLFSGAGSVQFQTLTFAASGSLKSSPLESLALPFNLPSLDVIRKRLVPLLILSFFFIFCFCFYFSVQFNLV